MQYENNSLRFALTSTPTSIVSGITTITTTATAITIAHVHWKGRHCRTRCRLHLVCCRGCISGGGRLLLRLRLRLLWLLSCRSPHVAARWPDVQ